MLVSAGAALLLAAAIAAAVVELRGGSSSRPLLAPPNSVAVIDPRTNRVEADVVVADGPAGIAVWGDDVWVMHPGLRTLSLLSRANLNVLGAVGLGGVPSDLLADRQGAWISDGSAGTVTLIDPASLAVKATIKTAAGPPAGRLAIGSGSLWVTAGRGTIDRIDLRMHKVIGQTHDAGIDVSISGGVHLYIPTISARFRSSQVALSEGAVWIPDTYDNQVWEIDSSTDTTVGTSKVGAAPVSAAYGGGAIWIANSGDGTVSRINPTSGEVERTIKITADGTPTGIAATDDGVWVTVD